MKRINKLIMLMALICGMVTSCGLMHEDDIECNDVIIRFNNITASDTDTFGLYVLDKNDIIVEENLKVYPNCRVEKDLYETKGNKYFIYTPYTLATNGMPVKGDKGFSYDIMVFFKPIATQNLGALMVARGTRMCLEVCPTYRFHFYEWQEEVPWWKQSINQNSNN